MNYYFEEIKTKLKIKNIEEISEWDYSYFTEKLNKIKNDKILFYKNKIKSKPYDKKNIKLDKRNFLKTINYFKKYYAPGVINFNLAESNNIQNFFSLYEDYKILLDFLEKEQSEIEVQNKCNFFIEKYKLDYKECGVKTLQEIKKLIYYNLENYYELGFFESGITFNKIKNKFEPNFYCLTNKERTEDFISTIKYNISNIRLLLIKMSLLLSSIILFVISNLINILWVSSLFTSIAISLLVTFLIELIHSYQKHISEKQESIEKKDILILKNYIIFFNKNYDKFFKSKVLRDKYFSFIDYLLDLNDFIKDLNKIRKHVSLRGQPFRTNYFTLKRFNDQVIKPLHNTISINPFNEQKINDIFENYEKTFSSILYKTIILVNDTSVNVIRNINIREDIEEFLKENLKK